jgi:hypothetical protein
MVLWICVMCYKSTDGLSVQVLGEIFRRLADPRGFRSRPMTAECVPLQTFLQPGVASLEEPSEPFPRSGFYMKGVYYAVNNCAGNIVNVRRVPFFCNS